MKAKAIQVVCLALIALIVVQSSVALAETYSMNPYTRSVEVAVSYWGRSVPCDGMPVIKIGSPPPVSEVSAGPLQASLQKGDAEVEAWVNLNESRTGKCTINLNSKVWNSTVAGVVEFHKLCNTVAHEVGHFMGFEDEGATNRASITYPEETPQNENSVPGCIHHAYSAAYLHKLERSVLEKERNRAQGTSSRAR